MIIYNLFPLLAGKFGEWEGHLLRASRMGFDWVFVNPVQRTGASGSLYSIADYFALNPSWSMPQAAKPVGNNWRKRSRRPGPWGSG